MAVPKNKVSKSKTNSRFANWKLSTPDLVQCPNCHELVRRHHTCPNCGYYKGEQIIEVQKADKN